MPDDLDDTTTDDTTTGGDVVDDDSTDTGATDNNGATDTTGGGKTAAKDRAPKIDGDFDPARAQRLIDRLRKEAADEKAAKRDAETKAADTLKAVAKALGLAEDDKPDPEALTRQLEEARTAERARRTENLVLRLAPGLGADPDVLLDSNAFLKAISGHGPDDRDDVEDTIRDFLKKSDRYKLPSAVKATDGDTSTTNTDSGEKKEPKKAAGRSGADMNGSTTRPRQWTRAELDAAVKAGRNQEIVAAQEAGLLDNLLSGA